MKEGAPMSFNPAGTKWSVAAFDNNGAISAPHPVPWEFNRQSMNAGNLWVGGYQPIPGNSNAFACEILSAGASDPSDVFEVEFVTNDRFIATKGGMLYRFGKRI
jgi:hypothetical protein